MRAEKSFKNSVFGIISQIVSLLLRFGVQTAIIRLLGAEYLGVNGLFANVLQMLSLAELGVGSAITYNLYKPLAEGDQIRIKGLMHFYKKAYQIIGLLIAIVGVCLIPFLDKLVNGSSGVSNLTLIYCLFLSNTVASYFFTYKRAILIADQRAYMDTNNVMVKNLLQTICQIAILYITKNYYIYLSIQVIATIISNICISKKTNKLYPYIVNNQEQLGRQEIRKIFKDVYALMAHKVGTVIVFATDNILISMFVGVASVGYYSNYVLMKNAIDQIIAQLFNAITASVGNLNALEKKERVFETYQSILFFNFWIYGFAAIGFFTCINPFIELWAGSSYLLTMDIVLLITINFYLTGIRKTTQIFKDTVGLFWNDRYKPYVESAINLIASIVLLNKLGFIGVLIGTLISTLTTSFWIEPYVLYKHSFERPLKDYFFRFTIYTVAMVFAGVCTVFVVSFVHIGGFLALILKIIMAIIVPNSILLLLFCKTKEFKYLIRLIDQLIRRFGIRMPKCLMK